jgi:hypothetical protein
MVKCHVRTFRQDLSMTRDKSQISARQVPYVMRDRRIDWNPTVYMVQDFSEICLSGYEYIYTILTW